jgi:hypothetical protein
MSAILQRFTAYLQQTFTTTGMHDQDKNAQLSARWTARFEQLAVEAYHTGAPVGDRAGHLQFDPPPNRRWNIVQPDDARLRVYFWCVEPGNDTANVGLFGALEYR